jgi:adenosylhomocysteinase
MPEAAYRKAAVDAIAWRPTHLCEFGADLTAAFLEAANPQMVCASLAGVRPPYPIFNWYDLPIKEGLHNRHMVGLTTWQTFFARTRLILHEKKVAVIGFGLVGQGVAETARAFGGTVIVVEVDPARALQATFDGWQVLSMAEALAQADVIATATGAKGVLQAESFRYLKEGAFLINVGHRADEIDLAELNAYPHRNVIPYVGEYDLNGKSVFLFAGGGDGQPDCWRGRQPERLRPDPGADGGRDRVYRRGGQAAGRVFAAQGGVGEGLVG